MREKNIHEKKLEAGQTDASDMAAPESLMAESVTAEELLNADLSTLELGANQVTSGEDGFNWYKFEAVKGRKYNIDPCATVQMYYIENGEIAEAAPNNVFRAEHTGTYYLGFCGPVYNPKTDRYDLYTFTTNISEIPLIEDITVGEIQNRNIISEFQITMGYGTEYTIDYNNGTSETVKVDDDSYTDQYGNTVQYIYRRKDDNSDTEYKYNDKKPAGDYTIQFCVKGDVLETTGWEYTSVNAQDAEGNVFGYWDYLPEGKYALVIYVNGVEAASSEPVYNVVDRSKAEKLEPGEVTLESGREEYRPHWYRFTAEETGKYCFQQSPQMKVIYFQEDTKEEEDTGRGSLRAKAGETYYIGFSGYVYNEDEEVYTWTTQLERKPAVTDIQATPVKSTFYEDRYENEYARFTLQFTYDDGSSASFASWRKYYDVDGKGNGINVYLTRKCNESRKI